MTILGRYKDNVNLYGVYAHVWSDVASTTMIVAGSILMNIWNAPRIDGILTLMVAMMILGQACRLTKDIYRTTHCSKETES